VKNICNGLSTTHIAAHEHQYLLDVLGVLACRVAMATADEPHGRVPKDLEDIMRAVQHSDAPCFFYISYRTMCFCAPALISLARHKPDLFPKRFARAIVHDLAPLELWNIACGVDGLDVEGIDVARIADADSGRHYLLECLNTRTPNAIELLIAPPIFSRILDAYEKQVEQEGPANMQLYR
jgi:hypothetical protein